jgi:adenylate cyclase
MSRISLKNILSPKSDAFAILSTVIGELHAKIHIEDASQKILFGQSTNGSVQKAAIKLDEETIGWVKGDQKVDAIATLLNILIQKEAEKKKLGSEVLLLYQQVNLIFDFSEKLAQHIGQTSIANIALEEASRLIKSDNGLIVLWDEKSSKIEVLASSGRPVFNQEKFRANVGLLIKISQSGQSEIMGDLSALKESGLILPEVQSLMYAALKVNHRVMGAIILASTEATPYAAADLKFLITLALQASSAIESALLYEKNISAAKAREEEMRHIYEVTNKFVPHEFIKSLGRSVITDVQLGDQIEKIVTVLFSDIRDYTTFAEQMTPEENFSFVCSFNELVGPIIRENRGFINQYLGDAIMAIFPENASDAIAAAINMQKAVQAFNEKRLLQDKTPIKIGVGLHTGPLIMGITGDHERMDATTIADTVNTASRLESLTKHYKESILLSQASVKDLTHPESFHLRYLGTVQLKGKHESIGVYECFDDNAVHDIDKKLTALPFFKQGMNAYFNKSFDQASKHFSQVLSICPEDTTAKLFLKKATSYLSLGVPENWTGVEEMHNK